MQNCYSVSLNGHEYHLPLMKINAHESIAIFDMLSSRAMADDAVADMHNLLRARGWDQPDIVLSAETKGIVLAHTLAALVPCEMVILRKEQKMYHPQVWREPVHTFTTDGEHYLYLNQALVPLLKGKQVLLVDDVISTGSSMAAMEKLMAKAGATVIGKAAVFAEGQAAQRTDIAFVHPLPILDVA